MAGRLLDHLGDSDSPSKEVDIAHSQTDCLTPAKAQNASNQNERPIPGWYLRSQALKLRRSQRDSSRRPGTRKGNLSSRRAADDLCIDRRVKTARKAEKSRATVAGAADFVRASTTP